MTIQGGNLVPVDRQQIALRGGFADGACNRSGQYRQ